MIFCLEIIREQEDPIIGHFEANRVPSRKEVYQYIEDLDLNFNRIRDEFNYWEVDLGKLTVL